MHDVLVVVHVVTAALWVGGVVALTFVVVPVAQRQDNPVRGELLRDLARRWRPLGWGALALAIASASSARTVRRRPGARSCSSAVRASPPRSRSPSWRCS